jgi:hypothetical protein
MKNTITLTNDFHRTKTHMRAVESQEISYQTLRRHARELCRVDGCQCSGLDGTRHSEYSIADMSTYDRRGPYVVVKN